MSTAADTTGHWDDVYATRAVDEVSWFQSEPTTSLELIDARDLDRRDGVVDVGGGASTLVDRLLDRGWSDVTVLDVSERALEVARQRLGDRAAQVGWIVADVRRWLPGRTFRLWHDRAVFHFLTSAGDRQAYVRTAADAVEVGGWLVVATFALDGPESCSGLSVRRHDAQTLARALAPAFEAVSSRREVHVTPAGVQQPFTWLVARRTGASPGGASH